MSLKFKHNDTIASIGDTVRVHQEIVEGDSKRIQVFEGIVIAIKNRGRNKTFTVRKIGANNLGVEKIFPVYLPSIKKVEVKRKGSVRRAKLYFLRQKQGMNQEKLLWLNRYVTNMINFFKQDRKLSSLIQQLLIKWKKKNSILLWSVFPQGVNQ